MKAALTLLALVYAVAAANGRHLAQLEGATSAFRMNTAGARGTTTSASTDVTTAVTPTASVSRGNARAEAFDATNRGGAAAFTSTSGYTGDRTGAFSMDHGVAIGQGGNYALAYGNPVAFTINGVPTARTAFGANAYGRGAYAAEAKHKGLGLIEEGTGPRAFSSNEVYTKKAAP